MFFCCSAKTHKKLKQNKLKETSTKSSKTQENQNIPPISTLKDTIFIANVGWVIKTDVFNNKTAELASEKPQNIEDSEAQEKEDALDMLQGFAYIEKKPDILLENRLKEIKKMFEIKGFGEEQKKIDVKSYRNTLLAGDQAPLDPVD